jgi:hypothetical protein
MMKTPIAVILMIVIGGAGFFGGYEYAKLGSKNGAAAGVPNFQNMTQEQRQQLRSANGGASPAGTNGARRLQGDGFTGGEVIKKDDTSITLKLQDGGSKIIFYSDATKVMKSSEGSLKDINVGENMTVTGKSNTDGSITADTLQLRPAGQPLGQVPGQDQTQNPPKD